MAYKPVSGVPVQYSTISNVLASGYYLKFYIANSSTALSMATDADAGTLLAYCKLSTSGRPISDPSNNETDFIPHLNQSYKSVLYPTETDAINDTNGVMTVVNTSLFLTNSENKQAYTSTYSSNVYTVTPEINLAVFAIEQAGLILNVRMPATATVTGDLSLNYDGNVNPICWADPAETRITTSELEAPDNTYFTIRKNAANTKWVVISDVTGSNSNGRWERLSNGWQICTGDLPVMTSTGWTNATTHSYKNVGAKSFPKTFLTTPNITPDSNDESVSSRAAWIPYLNKNSSGIIDCFYATTIAGTTIGGTSTGSYQAMGRWY